MDNLSKRRLGKIKQYVKENNIKRFIKVIQKYNLVIKNEKKCTKLLFSACIFGSDNIVRLLILII